MQILGDDGKEVYLKKALRYGVSSKSDENCVVLRGIKTALMKSRDAARCEWGMIVNQCWSVVVHLDERGSAYHPDRSIKVNLRASRTRCQLIELRLARCHLPWNASLADSPFAEAECAVKFPYEPGSVSEVDCHLQVWSRV